MRRPLVLLLGVCLNLTFANGIVAHELRPAYLDLRETAEETYALLWKKPAGEVRLSLRRNQFHGRTRLGPPFCFVNLARIPHGRSNLRMFSAVPSSGLEGLLSGVVPNVETLG